MLFPQL